MNFYNHLFNEKGIKHIKAYKNKGVDQSYIYNYIISPSLNVIVEVFPRWLAPNMITTLGLLCVISSTILCALFFPNLKYDPEFPAPDWIYFWVGLSVGIYQFMDNIDGKQARRTGAGSPLGHLFDHGCDALNTVFQVLTAACVFQWGAGYDLYWLYTFVAGLFWFATWEEYYTGALILRPINGPIEGLIGFQVLNYVTYYYGPDFWTQPVQDFIPSGLMSHIPAVVDTTIPTNSFLITYVIPPAAILTMVLNFVEVLVRVRKSKDHSIGEALQGMMTFVVLAGGMGTWVYTSTVDIISLHPWMFIILYGFIFCKVVSLLIVCHLVGHQYPAFDFALWLVPFAALNSLAKRYLVAQVPALNDVVLDEENMLYLMLLSAALDYYGFVQNVITQLTKHLDVYCFTIKPKAKTT